MKEIVGPRKSDCGLKCMLCYVYGTYNAIYNLVIADQQPAESKMQCDYLYN